MNLPALSETVKVATCVFLAVSLLWLCLSGCAHLVVCAMAPVCVCVKYLLVEGQLHDYCS